MGYSNNRFLALLRARGADPVIVAHRGDSIRAPENTLEAGRLAWQAGAAAWEIDVQLTRDNVPVVLHDESLLRTTDVAARFPDDPRGRAGFRVGDFDYDEIRKLDAGSWFVAADGGSAPRVLLARSSTSRRRRSHSTVPAGSTFPRWPRHSYSQKSTIGW